MIRRGKSAIGMAALRARLVVAILLLASMAIGSQPLPARAESAPVPSRSITADESKQPLMNRHRNGHDSEGEGAIDAANDALASDPSKASQKPLSEAHQRRPQPQGDLEDLLFKELPQPVVTSATKKEQPIYEAPSTITVITAEDIRRMGARRLVDVFRWTPGLDVFTLTGNRSSVSARGVYSLHTKHINEMLVLIDGRSVYVDFLGGVDWDTMPLLLEEIERIEIIRGPSGSLYGPNAAAGTISIFTKREPGKNVTRTTIGNKHFFESNTVHWIDGDNYDIRVSAGWLENEGFGSGGGRRFRDDVNYGTFNLFSHLQLDGDTGLELRGGWLTGQRGFEMFDIDAAGTEDTDVPYGHVVFEHSFSSDARLRAQYYHNHFIFDRPFVNGTERLETWTDVVTLEHAWKLNPCHQLIAGGEFRNFVAHSGIIDPDPVRENFRSLFAEDDITLIEKKLHLILGLRYDDFTVSGDDFSPRAALVWTPVPNHSFRASVARSIATPMTIASFIALDVPVDPDVLGIPGGTPVISRTRGNANLNPESFMAYELGYRGRWSDKLDAGLDLFLYDVADLMRPLVGAPTFDPVAGALVIPAHFSNEVDSLAYGAEASVTYRWSECLTSFVGYSFKEIPDVASAEQNFRGVENFKNSLIGSFDYRFLDSWLFSGRLAWRDGFALSRQFAAPEHLRVDLRLAKDILEGQATIEVIGQNLLGPQQPEANVDAEVPRTVYLGVEYRY